MKTQSTQTHKHKRRSLRRIKWRERIDAVRSCSLKEERVFLPRLIYPYRTSLSHIVCDATLFFLVHTRATGFSIQYRIFVSKKKGTAPIITRQFRFGQQTVSAPLRSASSPLPIVDERPESNILRGNVLKPSPIVAAVRASVTRTGRRFHVWNANIRVAFHRRDKQVRPCDARTPGRIVGRWTKVARDKVSIRRYRVNLAASAHLPPSRDSPLEKSPMILDSCFFVFTRTFGQLRA